MVRELFHFSSLRTLAPLLPLVASWLGLGQLDESCGVERAFHGYHYFLAAVLILALPLTGAAACGVAAWNVTAVDATLLAGQNPTVQSQALAATQAAVHDALNAIDRRFEPYAFHGEVDPPTPRQTRTWPRPPLRP